MDIWRSDVEKVDTLSRVSLLAVFNLLNGVKHVFCLVHCWGEEFFGISNALAGD